MEKTQVNKLPDWSSLTDAEREYYKTVSSDWIIDPSNVAVDNARNSVVTLDVSKRNRYEVEAILTFDFAENDRQLLNAYGPIYVNFGGVYEGYFLSENVKPLQDNTEVKQIFNFDACPGYNLGEIIRHWYDSVHITVLGQMAYLRAFDEEIRNSNV